MTFKKKIIKKKGTTFSLFSKGKRFVTTKEEKYDTGSHLYFLTKYRTNVGGGKAKQYYEGQRYKKGSSKLPRTKIFESEKEFFEYYPQIRKKGKRVID